MLTVSDVKYALRFLMRTPAFSVPAVASLPLPTPTPTRCCRARPRVIAVGRN